MARGNNVVLTNEEYEKLTGKLTALQEQVTELGDSQRQLIRTSREALRRVTFMPPAVKQLLNVENISAGTLGADGTSMVYELGGTLTLTLSPFDESYTLTDVSGKLAPLTCKFGANGDVTPDSVLFMLGYASLADRPEITQTPGYWAAALNGLTTVS